MEAIPVVAGVAGGLLGKKSSPDEITQKTEPWGPAQPYLLGSQVNPYLTQGIPQTNAPWISWMERLAAGAPGSWLEAPPPATPWDPRITGQNSFIPQPGGPWGYGQPDYSHVADIRDLIAPGGLGGLGGENVYGGMTGGQTPQEQASGGLPVGPEGPFVPPVTETQPISNQKPVEPAAPAGGGMDAMWEEMDRQFIEEKGLVDPDTGMLNPLPSLRAGYRYGQVPSWLTRDIQGAQARGPWIQAAQNLGFGG